MWEAPALLIVLSALVWYVFDALRARETATRFARDACKQRGLQLLDDTVHGARMRFARDAEGIARLRRVFVFEFSEDGFGRRSGTLTVLGAHVEAVQFEPYRAG